MKFDRHLFLSEVNLPPSSEWMDSSPGWRMVRVSSGAAYWLGEDGARELQPGELVAVAPGSKGCLRSSQLGDVKLHYFQFCPELLGGFLALAERHYFETVAAQAGKGTRFLPLTHPAAQEFAELVGESVLANNLVARCRFLHVVAQIFADEMARHQPPMLRSAAALGRFKKLINEMPDSDLPNYTPEQLAKLCGCSVRHFSRLFRQHFGAGIRARQTELRLLKARQLLSDTDAKIIHVALESGYRHLGLFNSMFKKYLGMTPSQWRHRHVKKPRPQKFNRAASLLLAVCCLVLIPSLHAGGPVVKPAVAAVNPSPTNTPSASKTTNTITFAVEGYEITGNTLFRYADLEPIFKKFVGPAVGFETIRQALAEFQMAYRNRGFVTVSVTLPPQQLTNGLVKVKVVEGRLKEINVVNNHYFSSNNIMRALPSLQTNILLNSLVFQRDLDRANGNRDRQIYPVIGPGPEPGTTALNLKVKDRLPLHWRMELNDYSTPNTPELRLNTSAQYNNLWQLEHQVGLQYSFTPEAMKDVNQLPAFYDQPLIANYSAFYRMPLDFGKAKDRGRPLQISDFGYDEVTKRFRPPPAGEFPDLIFYASRSFSDTGLGLQSESVTQPSDFDTNGGLQVTDQVLSQTLVKNESLGSRISVPLSDFAGFRSSLSGGLDYKSYRSEILQREQFTGLIRVPVQGRPGEFDIIPVPNPPPPTDKTTHHSVQYLPLTVAYDISKADKWGLTAFNLSASFNISALFDSKRDFQSTAGSSKADGNYAILIPGLTREQKLFSGSPNRGDIGDWAIRIRADGQWANQPLINNEQFGIGGLAGVRGYHDGQEYGDTGWRTIVEPHTPLLKIGMVDETLPMYMRFFAFNDYGRRYLLAPSAGRDTSLGLWGAGFGFNAVIGDHWDFRFALGFPLLDVPGVKAGNPRALFSISAQF